MTRIKVVTKNKSKKRRFCLGGSVPGNHCTYQGGNHCHAYSCRQEIGSAKADHCHSTFSHQQPTCRRPKQLKGRCMFLLFRKAANYYHSRADLGARTHSRCVVLVARCCNRSNRLSKGRYAGASLDGKVVTTRDDVNERSTAIPCGSSTF
jgi:hypothetical protein